MNKEILKTKGNILVELIIKGYTENFLKIFLVFFKQRFFSNFLKSSNNIVIFNKYTLLRSSFVNKSSREQIEKRIYKKKVNLLFSEFEFKLFYSTLSALNFKGISLKMSKYYFLNKKMLNSYNYLENFLFEKKLFKHLWNELSLKTKQFLVNKNENINKVFTTISCKNSLSKHIGLKFLRSKSLRKNRLKKGLFKVFFKKPNFFEKYIFEKSFFILRNKRLNHLLDLKNSFIKRKPSIFSLSYSYSFNTNVRLNGKKSLANNKFFITHYFSNNEKLKLYSKPSVLNSICCYRNCFIWWLFINNRRKSDYRGGLSKQVVLDKFNIYFKLILGLKTGPFKSRHNMLFKNNFNFILNSDKNFYIFIKLLNKTNLKGLNKYINIKSLFLENRNKKIYTNVLKVLKKSKNNRKVVVNPWLVRRYISKNLNLKSKRNILKVYEKNSLIKSLNNIVYFKSKALYFFLVWYKKSLKGSSKRTKFHLKKRLRYVLRRNWGILWRLKSKNKFFFRFRKKKNFWKKCNRHFKNNYQKRKFKQKFFKKKRYKFAYRKRRLKKRYLSLFFKKI